MNVVDSSGWIEFFNKGSNALFFSSVIKNFSDLIVPTISIYEVFKVVRRHYGDDYAIKSIIFMRQGHLIPLDDTIALAAARISLPMADSIILATAQIHQATLWTQDVDFKKMPGVKYIEKKRRG